ncbi:hypothetical protein GCM10027030_28820 [Luteococcus sediminum]
MDVGTAPGWGGVRAVPLCIRQSELLCNRYIRRILSNGRVDRRNEAPRARGDAPALEDLS